MKRGILSNLIIAYLLEEQNTLCTPPAGGKSQSGGISSSANSASVSRFSFSITPSDNSRRDGFHRAVHAHIGSKMVGKLKKNAVHDFFVFQRISTFFSIFSTGFGNRAHSVCQDNSSQTAASAAIVVVSTITAGRAAEVAVERRHVIPAIIFQWKTCFSCSNPPVHLIQ